LLPARGPGMIGAMRVLGVGLLIALLFLFATALLYIQRWSVGGPAAVDWRRGLRRLPHAYLRDVHDVVSRETLAGAMHALTAGGLLASLLLLALMAWLGWRDWIPALLLLASLACLMAGALLVARRRFPRRPPRFSGGSFQILPILLIAYGLAAAPIGFAGIGLLPHGSRAMTLGQILTSLALLLLVGLVARGPMKHALAGTLHLILHARPARFAGARPSVDLVPLDLSQPRLGVACIADCAWNELVSFDACIQCGRCEAACPANAAGQPLNPKAMIQDFVAAMPRGFLTEPYSGSPHPPRIGESIGPVIQLGGDGRGQVGLETIWSCTTCRACVHECPMMIEHVDAIMALRRHQTLALGATPGKGAEVLEELKATDNPGGRTLASRLDWAADLNLPLIAQRGSCEVLLWLGDAAFDLRGQRSLRSLVRLLRQANVDFAVLGAEELDCGDLARRLGEEAVFQDLARRNIGILDGYRFQRILTADPHVLHCLKNEYPAFGGRYEVVHHTTYLAELLKARRLVPTKALGGAVTFHDPCYLGRYNGEIEAPRGILERIGVERREMERSGLRSFCCGGGGGAAVTDIAGKRRIPDLRMEQARATGAATLVVACPNCAVMLEGVVGPRPAIADVVELLEAAL
jgi:N,N-dimethylglycine/sarcosine dehydrogenase ferredoxin subunit